MIYLTVGDLDIPAADSRQVPCNLKRLATRSTQVEMLLNSLRVPDIAFYVYRVFASRRVNSRADRRSKVAEVLATSFPMVVGYATGDGKTNGAVLINGKSEGLEKMLARQWLLENGYEEHRNTH